MRILPIFKHSINKYIYQNTERYISKEIIPFYSNYNEEKQKENFILKKIQEVNDWYVKLTGLDEVKRLQNKVIQTQEKLEKAQDERREIGKILADIRKKSADIQEQLHNMKRWDDVDRYLELVKQDTEVMKIEKELIDKFEMLDKTEREIFTILSNVVRDSHEKEKAQSEITKYWGIIFSIVGTIIGAVVSSLISTIRNNQIVNGINEGMENKFNEILSLQKLNKDVKSNVIDKIFEKLNNTERQINKLTSTIPTVKRVVINSSDEVTKNELKGMIIGTAGIALVIYILGKIFG